MDDEGHPRQGYRIEMDGTTGMVGPTWKFCYQDWACDEGTIRRLKMWTDGRVTNTEVLWKWSFLAKKFEEKGISLKPDSYSEIHIAVQEHDVVIRPSEENAVLCDRLRICWEK